MQVALIMDDDFLEWFNFDDTDQRIKFMNDVHCSHVAGWMPKKKVYEELSPQTKKLIPSNIEAPILELKSLPEDLKYSFFWPTFFFFGGHLSVTCWEPGRAFDIGTSKYKGDFGWNMADIKGIDPLICIYHITLEDGAKPIREMQWRLNPAIKEVVKAEVLKLLDTTLSI